MRSTFVEIATRETAKRQPLAASRRRVTVRHAMTTRMQPGCHSISHVRAPALSIYIAPSTSVNIYTRPPSAAVRRPVPTLHGSRRWHGSHLERRCYFKTTANKKCIITQKLLDRFLQNSVKILHTDHGTNH